MTFDPNIHYSTIVLFNALNRNDNWTPNQSKSSLYCLLQLPTKDSCLEPSLSQHPK